MLPDRVSNPGPLTYESGALPIALRGPAKKKQKNKRTCCWVDRETFTVACRTVPDSNPHFDVL